MGLTTTQKEIRMKEEIRREKQVGGRTRQGTNRKTEEKLILSSVIGREKT